MMELKKGGDYVITVNVEKLKEIASNAGFESLEAVADEAKRRGVSLSLATVYNIANNQNWTRQKLETLCEIIRCQPTDFVDFGDNGRNTHTHESPQPDKVGA